MRAYITVAGLRFGYEQSRVPVAGKPYLDRWILWCGIGIRLHRFWRGDDDRACHDHPWWFWTFPFTDYGEVVEIPLVEPGDPGAERKPKLRCYIKRVRARRWHYRPATYRHRVIGRMEGPAGPFWTIVICGPQSRQWGFWPAWDRFVHWKEWK